MGPTLSSLIIPFPHIVIGFIPLDLQFEEYRLEPEVSFSHYLTMQLWGTDNHTDIATYRLNQNQLMIYKC